ncbi:MAG: 50S ribosomal protein L3 N(5)-glutamine methyltransferase [Tatlockia sp.]|nr:50S ribosomal protein L3 N(5)-glutamine methyltransferase [Tatlockia sp.]
MTDSYALKTTSFETILDFIRYGLSEAAKSNLHFGHGTDNAFDDIHSLVLRTLSLPFDCDPMFYQARLTSEEKELLANRLSRRIIEKVPVPYLINEAYFCDLSFYVDERVLIPRSPIAELIKQQFSPWIEADKVERILDLCTGSGCIAIACSLAFPDALVDAVDISTDALDVAAINQQDYDLESVLTIIESDCWQNVPHVQYDIIVSNPPYVGHEEMQGLPKEYLHEPQLALETDNNGLAIVEKILANAHDYLSEHGVLVVEVGSGEEALTQAYPQVPFLWLDFEHGGEGVFLLTRQQLQEHFMPKGK